MSTKYFLGVGGGKGGQCIGLTTLQTSSAECLEIWEPQPPGTPRACQGLEWDCFTFTFINYLYLIFFKKILKAVTQFFQYP